MTAVDPSGPNADRLAPGDVIQEAAGHPIETPRDLASAMREARGKGVMLMKVLRQGNPVYVAPKWPRPDKRRRPGRVPRGPGRSAGSTGP